MPVRIGGKRVMDKPGRSDLTGMKFGMLTAIKRSGKTKYGNAKWLCVCDCGGEGVFVSSNLKNGNTKSCGCNKHLFKQTHGLNGTRLAHCYDSMKSRCYNENYYRFDRYGGRGIKVCDEWLDDIENFFKWSYENGYDDTLTLDRIDNDGDYEPNNCRWSTKKEQANNTKRTIMIEIDGVTKPLQEWCEFYGIDQFAVYSRRRRGIRGKALFKPARRRKKNVG
ncbi:hypothetical protein D3C73_387920 [compost metagenome]